MFLGLDLGTSELKALLLNEQHQVLATARAPLTVQRPQALWSEQDPASWWQALQQVMDHLQRSHPTALSQLQGVGLSGQMHGAVLMDAQGEVLRPAILWNDGRSGAQCEQLTAQVPDLSRITGNLAMPGFTAPKLLWVRAHEPELFARTRRVLLPKDWLRWKLTGEAVSDMSDAAGTLWLDTALRDWSDTLLAACGLDRSHMPRLVEGSEVSAFLKPELCHRWGLPERVAVAGGAGDNAASAVGMGLVQPGQGFVSLGTSGVVFVSGARFSPNPAQGLHAFCHALPGRWHQMSVMLSAASAVTWAAKQLAFADEASLLAAATQLPEADRRTAPLFLPYLSGERTPHNQPLATASWWGLTAAHGREALAYAVAEGVAFGLRDGLQTLGTSKPEIQHLSLVGGGARNAWWAQLMADVLGLSLTLHEGAETGAALGAARLAWLACGGALDAVCTTPPVTRSFTPNATAHAAHSQRHTRFQALYRAVSPLI
ncbi:xylulokinase [Limnohabitans planktonicus]|uniref:Xylulose kinase n=1 Tax=Limnohabitans planktonicus II-D5 TaxID=1293045 RepID=A0A2T7U8Z9_9BURK|nr:xylulokinase [Limnohabitans planktonicus]PVE41165.1 xylulokinase [Limnohabitans planktonicus II-D5]|eukprot:gene27190-32854_t